MSATASSSQPIGPSSTSSRIEQIEEALSHYADFQQECPTDLRSAIRYSLLAPGKRLRPRMVLMATEACGGRAETAMPAAVAVEMIHAYSLVHDDLPAMDNDDLRRGQATCHVQFNEATAILVGDALQARAFEVLATELQPAELGLKCCAELARAAGAEALVGGQAADLAAESHDISLAQLESIHGRKTGALFRSALRLGAIVAGASDQAIDHLDRFGRKLGLAFQIVDDLLDVSGVETKSSDLAGFQAGDTQPDSGHLSANEKHVGKRLGKDKQRGKATYPLLLGTGESGRQVEKLIGEAHQAIAPFGKAGLPLQQLATQLGRRNR
jgi:geranylgeranyl diphosphate synthase, type II